MKLYNKGNLLKGWKTSSVAGIGFTGIGLICAVVIISQLLPPILNGQAPGISTLEMALEATVAMVFLMVGFALMVIGSDPFEDRSQDFDFQQDRDKLL